MRFLEFLCSTVALLAYAVIVSASQAVADIDNIEWFDESWIIKSKTLLPGKYQTRMSLANGYLGINVAALGPFFEIDVSDGVNYKNGWPLFSRRQSFASIAGFYDSNDKSGGSNYPWLNQYGGDSFLSGVPHWAGLKVEANGQLLHAATPLEQISGFTTSLDIQGGILSWTFTWTPANDAMINVEYQMFVHKLNVNQAAVQLKLTSSRNIDLTVYDVIEGASATRTEFVDKKYEAESATIWSAVKPRNIDDVIAYVVSTLVSNQPEYRDTRREVKEDIFEEVHSASVGQSIKITLRGGETAEVTKFIGAASSDAFEDPRGTALAASAAGANAGFIALRQSHVKEWETILTRDSVDNYHDPHGTLPSSRRIRELQVSSVMNPFMILQNTVGPNAIAAAGNNPRLNINSIPVCGLGSECYGGLIFWDAETWMALGLQLSHPRHIENVVNYRVEKHPQAQENVKMAFSSSKNKTGRFTGGAVYPWTSGRYGNCTASGPCFDYEYHLNGDIGISLRNQFIATGDSEDFKTRFLPVMNDIAYFYGEVVDFNETSGYYEIWNATDPDEYANNVNNAGFTTALIQRHLNETNELNTMFGLPQNETWNVISAKMRLPVVEDVGIVREYGSMNGSVAVKQADVVLIDDILNYENPYSLADLDYYANKQSPDGPGMTYATFSIVANEISPSGCSSFTYDHYSSQPYAREPWFQYSEQMMDNFLLNGGTHPAFPFLTGMGGANRVAIFGYLGLRMFVDKLDIDPSLPPQIPYLNYRTFYWHGYGIKATSNTTHTVLERIPGRTLDTANLAYKDAIPVTLGTRPGVYSLTPSAPLTLPNRLLGQTRTLANNILQCKPVVFSKQITNLPGQFPLGAIDGATSTKWQPENASRTSWISVDVNPEVFARVEAVYLDWGNQPPSQFELLVSNTSLPPFQDESADVRLVTSGNVDISAPWAPERANTIQMVAGNQTNITITQSERVHAGRYFHLGVWGNQATGNAGVGPTVAEWSVVLEGSGQDDESDAAIAKAKAKMGERERLWVQGGEGLGVKRAA